MLPAENREFAALLAEGQRSGRLGKFSPAIECFRRAIRLCPEHADGHFNLGVAYRSLKRWNEARAALERAVQLQPQWPEAQFNLGNCYRDERRIDEAIACFEAALRVRPDYPKALNNLASLLRGRGEAKRAEELLRRAIALDPRHASAFFNLGGLLRERGELSAALECLVQALEICPDSPAYQTERDEILRGLLRQRAKDYRHAKRYDEALAEIDKLLAVDPRSAAAYTLRGSVLMLQGDVHGAIEAYERALAIKPGLVQVLCAIATAYYLLRRPSDARRALEAAIRFKPDFAPAHVNRGQLALSMGDFAVGWRKLEWRLLGNVRRFTPRRIAHWAGEALQGKSILLRAEQGLGDTFQFIRYARLMKEEDTRVIVECQDAACALVATAPGVDAVVRQGEPVGPVDFQAPLLSLPGMCGTVLQTVPGETPYLFAEAERVAAWRERLRPLGQLVVGIAWQGNREYQGDHFRSAPLREFAPLAKVPGIALVSLQKHDGVEQLQEELGFEVHAFSEQDADGPFRDTAAMIAACDLVIATDSAIVHLAGALGRPVWVALGYSPEWRWMLWGDTSPWYPTMRLYRQASFRDWASVFDPMAADLAANSQHLLPAPKPASFLPLQVPLAPAEIIDRFLILELKREHAGDAQVQDIVSRELSELREAYEACARSNDRELARLIDRLREVNRALWAAEDDLRVYERVGDFGPRFIETARLILHTNDERSRIKRRINELLHSPLGDVKIYRGE
jgi:tetratricopeptide (TPR) repeat protein